MPTELVELAPFPKADIGNCEQVVLGEERDRDDRILPPELHAPDPLRIPPDGPHGPLVETEALAKTGGEDQFIVPVRQDYVYEPIVLLQPDRVGSGGSRVGELVKTNLDCLPELRG